MTNRPDLHTPEHDQWDQGGYCNNLVTDDDGCGTVCGYRKPREKRPGEVLTPLGAVVRLNALPPHLMAQIEDDLHGTMLRLFMQDWTLDRMYAEVVLSGENRRELAMHLLEGLGLGLEQIILAELKRQAMEEGWDAPYVNEEFRSDGVTIFDGDLNYRALAEAIEKHLTVPRNED
jgi:hypothetical protein